MEEIHLPRIELGTQPSGATVPYAMLDAQVPYRVLDGGSDELLDEGASRRWIEWLRSSEAGRARYAVGFFASAGAPVAGLLESLAALSVLATWAHSWLPVVFQGRYNASYQTIMYPEKPSSRLPRSVTTEAEALFQSLVHDFTFVTLTTARVARPSLGWRLQRRDALPKLRRDRYASSTPRIEYLPTLWDDPPWVDPVREVADFVNHAALDSSDGVRHAVGSGDCLNRLARRLSGDKAPDAGPFHEIAPDPPGEIAVHLGLLAQQDQAAATPLHPPRKSDPPATPETLVAARDFRQAGFFARLRRLSDEDLARGLSATWRKREWEELPRDPKALDERLLTLDAERTWYDDPEADVSPGAKSYCSFLRELAKLSGGALKITYVTEDWESQPGSVVVSFRLNGERHRLVLDDMADWINPFAVVRLNDLLPVDGPRFYFVDNGGQMAILTRVTEEERKVFEGARPTRLLSEPPEWWVRAAG